MTIITLVSTTRVNVRCERCGGIFEAKVADRKRGWARFCSKSCKAIKQTYGKNAFRPESKS